MRNIWVKISYFWFIFMLFIVGLLSGNLELKAATLTPSSTQFDARYSTFSCSVSGHNCYLSDGGSWVGTVNMGSVIYGPDNKTYNQLSLKYYYSSNFVAGNTYVFKIRINTTYPDFDNINKFVLINVKGGNSTSELDIGNIQSSALISKSADTENDKVYYMTFSITPLVNIKYIWIYVGYKPINQVFKNGVSTGNIVVKNSGVSYSEGIGSQIDQQTQTIENQTIIIQNEFNDLSNTITENNNNLINAITEDNKVCTTKTYNKSYAVTNGSYLNSSGVSTANSTNSISDWIAINENTTIRQTYYVGSRYACFYTEDKTVISCLQQSSAINNTDYTIPENAKFFRFSINNNLNRELFVITTCNSGNQSMQDTLTDSSVDDPSNMLSEMEDLLPNNGTITNLIALPITLYQKVLNSINGTCSAYSLGSLYGTNLVLPCIDISDYLGSTIWNTIDIILSGMTVYFIARKMIKAFEGFTSMKDGDVIND